MTLLSASDLQNGYVTKSLRCMTVKNAFGHPTSSYSTPRLRLGDARGIVFGMEHLPSALYCRASSSAAEDFPAWG